jgi:hypothetical protein
MCVWDYVRVLNTAQENGCSGSSGILYVFWLGLVTATNTQILLPTYVVNVVIESCSKTVGCLDFEELLPHHH